MKTKTHSASEIKKNWHLIDADGVILGKVASRAAHILRGKHKPTYSPHLDDGDYVIVINSQKVKVTGKKNNEKIYFSHTGHVGNAKEVSLAVLRQKNPNKIIESAVKGMLSGNRLGRAQLGHLKVYKDAKHTHAAQQPVPVTL